MRIPAFIDAQFPQSAGLDAPPQTGLFGRLIAAVRRDLAYRQAAFELAQMDDRMLADIGVSRGELPWAVRGKFGDPR
jgi:uncharacterized protein YjiS (DUF1127 family)